MNPHAPKPGAPHAGSLDHFLAPSELAPIRSLNEGEWRRLRIRGLVPLLWHFCTLRNLVAYRGFFPGDILGFGWAGIYRSLLVPSIVATSYRNEGHLRPRERVDGTEAFFGGAFRKPKADRSFRQIIRTVNLRHHVAGVVRRVGDDVEVLPGYEADFAYVSTAFIEGIRRGYELCGVSRNSSKGRGIAEDLCTILYQIAGMAGLRRAPATLEAHERFCAAFESFHDAHPYSPRMLATAREIAHKIFPVTAAFSGVSLEQHFNRHLDPRTSAFLFPEGKKALAPLEENYRRQRERFRKGASVAGSFLSRFIKKPDPVVAEDPLADLWAAFDRTIGEPEEGKLIGSIILFAMETQPGNPPWYRTRRMVLEPGEALIRQGEMMDCMYVLLNTTTPLHMRRADSGDQIEIMSITGPAVLGEMCLWREKPSFYSVVARERAELEMVIIDRRHFEDLRTNTGFRTATAAEVHHRLKLDTELLENLLEHQIRCEGHAELDDVARLLRYVTGDSTASLDGIAGLVPEATLSECVELLRHKTHDLVAAQPPSALRDLLAEIVDSIR